jgi:hypothetical protein
MEPNKLDNEFRKKLNEREINPSDRAWDRLDAMLNVAEESKPKRKYTWLYIAAGFVGFLLVSTIYLGQRGISINNLNNNVVVEEGQKKDSVVEPKNSIKDVIISKPSDTNVIVIKETKKGVDKKTGEVNPGRENQNQVAERSIIKETNSENWKNNQTSIAEDLKDASVDQLLTSAEKTVAIDKSTAQKTKVKINANDLLSQVDGELELSFREKVITRVNKNYQTVKVALANRNVEE